MSCEHNRGTNKCSLKLSVYLYHRLTRNQIPPEWRNRITPAFSIERRAQRDQRWLSARSYCTRLHRCPPSHGISGTPYSRAWMSPALLCHSTALRPVSWSICGNNGRRGSRRPAHTPCMIWRMPFAANRPDRRQCWTRFGYHREHLKRIDRRKCVRFY